MLTSVVPVWGPAGTDRTLVPHSGEPVSITTFIFFGVECVDRRYVHSAQCIRLEQWFIFWLFLVIRDLPAIAVEHPPRLFFYCVIFVFTKDESYQLLIRYNKLYVQMFVVLFIICCIFPVFTMKTFTCPVNSTILWRFAKRHNILAWGRQLLWWVWLLISVNWYSGSRQEWIKCSSVNSFSQRSHEHCLSFGKVKTNLYLYL